MRRLTLFLPALLAGMFPAVAAADDKRFALTPMVGARFGGNFDVQDSESRIRLDDSASFGLLFNARHGPNTTWEVLYSLQQTDGRLDDPSTTSERFNTDLHVLQFGGTYHGDGQNVQPYVALTLGGTHVRTSRNGSESDTFFSGSIGVGADIWPNRPFGLRLEARAYGTLTSASTDLFCRTGPDANVCAIRVDSTVLSQVEVFAGFSFRF